MKTLVSAAVALRLLLPSSEGRAQMVMSPNLIDDPRFEVGTSGFTTDNAANVVFRSTRTPVQGRASLRANVYRAGSSVYWRETFAEPGRFQAFSVAATVRGDIVPQGVSVRLCAAARTPLGVRERCTRLPLVAGRSARGQVALPLDAGVPVREIRLLLRHGAAARYSLDSVSARLTPASDGLDDEAPARVEKVRAAARN
jgi:hypothetical protein